ncbi:MAG: glutamate 5-kinase [Armatimonadia bacterium]|nr:glutamate 5-kinase [Armatimonadia bacterium]
MRESDVESSNNNGLRRIVVKVGTRLVVDEDGQPRRDFLSRLSEEVRGLIDDGTEVLLVTSGAVGIGRRKIARPGKRLRPNERPSAAAVGQPVLMRYWSEAMAEVGITCAQVLLTQDDVVNRGRCLRLRETLEDLLGWGVLPVLNENDSVSTESVTFGENDLMAAMVAVAITPAQLLVILSDQAGLFTDDPRSNAEARLICEVQPHEDVGRFASGAGGPESLGGMAKKIEAARRATDCGIRVVIADGNADRVLSRVLSDERIGTCMLARPRMPSRKAWLAVHLMPQGALVVDDGARRALQHPDGASLLPIGITEVHGEFREGDLVTVRDAEGSEIARGLVNYSASETAAIKGAHSSEIAELIGREGEPEVIHRDDMVVNSVDA